MWELKIEILRYARMTACNVILCKSESASDRIGYRDVDIDVDAESSLVCMCMCMIGHVLPRVVWYTVI